MNGNDVLEVIEENQAAIEEDFILQFDRHELAILLLTGGNLEELKKVNDFDEFANEWAEDHMVEEYDRKHDTMKDTKIMGDN